MKNTIIEFIFSLHVFNNKYILYKKMIKESSSYKKKNRRTLKLSFLFTVIILEPVKFVVLAYVGSVLVFMGTEIVREMIQSSVSSSKIIICQTIGFSFQIDVIFLASVFAEFFEVILRIE